MLRYMKKFIMVLGLFLAFSTPSYAAITTNLGYGSSGSQVIELQEFLTEGGLYTGPITGNFYSLTLASVKRYQASKGIDATGYVGPLTRAAIEGDLGNLVDESGTSTIPVVAVGGCQVGYLFNPSTGQSCTVAPTVCGSGALFNSLTGQSCTVTTPVTNPINPAPVVTQPTTPTIGAATTTIQAPIPEPYYPIKVLSFIKENVCVARGVNGTFYAQGKLATINLTGTTTSPITFPNTKDYMSITSNSSKFIDRINLDQLGGYEFNFEVNGTGSNTLGTIGSGGSLSMVPITVHVNWGPVQELPTTIDLTINHIKFADGTQVGGLPLTLSGLKITECTN